MTPEHRITSELDLDMLYDEYQDSRYDRLTFMRDDRGRWYANVQFETDYGSADTWFTVAEDLRTTLDVLHATGVVSMGGRA